MTDLMLPEPTRVISELRAVEDFHSACGLHTNDTTEYSWSGTFPTHSWHIPDPATVLRLDSRVMMCEVHYNQWMQIGSQDTT